MAGIELVADYLNWTAPPRCFTIVSMPLKELPENLKSYIVDP
jgi:hypothetical protein